MPRRPYTPNANLPYHITARSHNRDWFDVPISDLWSLYSDYLYLLHHGFGVRIHSFVLMSNHYHLIAQTPLANLSQAMHYLQGETSREITRMSGIINQTYGGPYKASLINSNHYFNYAYKYVYRNPVEAGLCRRVEEYPYSTLNGLVGRSHCLIPVLEDINLFEDTESHLTWLNTPYPNQDAKELIQTALRKRIFKFANTKDRKEHPYSSQML